MPKINVLLAAFFLSVVLLLQGNGAYAQECSLPAGTLSFAEGSSALSSTVRERLDQLADDLKASPNCKVVVQGNGSTTKPAQQMSWQRATTIIEYLSDNGNIIRERFIIVIGGVGNEREATFRAARETETGPSTLPPPFPQYQR